MKKIKLLSLSLLSVAMLFWANYRTAVVGVGAANVLCLVSQAAMYNVAATSPDAQAGAATSANNSVSFNNADGGSSAMGGAIAGAGRMSGKKGFQFKDPIVTPGFSYRSYSDGAPGGFAGNEAGADISLDADIYDGLIAGVYYAHTYRGGSNSLATSEHLESDGVSAYLGHRWFDIMNTGIAYNYSSTRHRLTRAVQLNLDRDSHGFTVLWGASDRMGHWSWNVTPSVTFVHDDYANFKAMETTRASVNMGLNYDAAKWVTIGGALGYHNFVKQDTFPNSTIRDSDYFTIGPRVRFIPMDNFAINVEFDDQEGFTDYRSYYAHVGFEVAF